MSLFEFFSDDYEPEERTTTLSRKDMDAAQAAEQLRQITRKSADEQLGVCNIWVSFIEIYNENIFDLLQPYTTKRNRLTLGEDKNGNVFVKGVREVCVSNSDEALKLLNLGRKQLSIASTKMNYQSSRSHCIYTIRIVRVPDPKNLSFGKVSRLSFCDLAGSERASKTQTTGMRMKEAGAINISLLVLGRCLEQLRSNQMRKDKRLIPFRESKLTRIFSSFLLGQGKAVMIANASPCDYTFDETLHVLKFSAVARKLMVNDTFLTTASRTIQSFTDNWKANKENTSNVSFVNESMDSVESDSDIIQIKDDLIEKILEHAEMLRKELAKVKKENVELEMKIRDDVYQEYSVYSDQLLANGRLNHQQELNSIIDSYKSRLVKMETMYENIIKGYKEQLGESETEESFAETSMNSDTSVKELNYTYRKSLTKISESDFLNKDSALSEPTQNDDMEALKLKLLSATSDLAKTMQELSEKQNTLSNMEIELSISKTENQKLTQQCAEYQSSVSKLTAAAETDKSELKSLELKLKSARNELEASNEKFQKKTFTVGELESEVSTTKNEVGLLNTKIDELKSLKSSNEKLLEIYELNIKTLEEKQSSSLKECHTLKDQMKSQSATISDLEKEIKMHKHENEVLKKDNAEITQQIEENATEVKTLKEKMISLQKEITVAQEHCEINSKTINKLKSELGTSNEEYQKLSKQCSEYQSIVSDLNEAAAKHENEVKCLEEKLVSARDQLSASNEKVQLKEFNICELETEMEVFKAKIEVLTTEICDLKMANQVLNSCQVSNEADIGNYKQNIKALEDQISNYQRTDLKNEDTEVHLKTIADLKGEIEILKEHIQALKVSGDSEKSETDPVMLKEQLTSLQTELTLTKEESEFKTNKMDKLLTEIEILKEHTQAQKFSDDSEKKSETDSAMKILKEQLSSLKTELAFTKDESVLKTSNMEKLQTEIELSRKRVLDMKKSLKETANIQSLHVKELGKYKERLQQLEKELESSNKNCDYLKKDVKVRVAVNEQLQKEIDSCKEKFDIIKSEHHDIESKLKFDIKEYKETLWSLEGESSSLKSELNALRRDQQMKSKFVTELEYKMDTYKMEIENLRKDNDRHEVERSKMKADISKYESIVSETDLELASSKSENETLKTKLKEKRNTLSKLEKQMKENETKCIKQDSDMKPDSDIKPETGNSAIKPESDVDGSNLKKLEKELSWTCEELASSKINLQMKSLKISELEAQIEADKKKMEKYKHETKKSLAEKSRLSSEMKGWEVKIKDLEEKLSVANSESEVARIHSLKTINLLEKENQSCVQEVENLKKELEALQTQKLELISQLSTCETKIKELEENLTVAKQENQSLKDDLKESRANGEKITLLLSDIEERFHQEIEDCKQKSIKLKDDFERSEAEKENLKNFISRNNAQLDDIKRQFSLADVELKSAKGEILQKSTIIQELKDKMKSLVSEINSLKGLQKEFEAEKFAFNIEIASYKDQTKDLQQKLNFTKEWLNSTKKEIEEKKTVLKQLEEEKLAYKSEMEKCAIKSNLEAETTLKTEMGAFKEKLESVKEELKFTHEKLRIQLLSCKEMEEEVSQLNKKLEEKAVEVETLVEALKEAKVEIDVTKTQQQHLKEEVSSMQNLKNTLEEKHDYLSKELASLTSCNKSLKDQLSLSENSSLQHKKQAESLSKDVEDLLLLNDSLELKVSTFEDSQTEIEELLRLIYVLEQVELSYNIKLKTLLSEIKNQESVIQDINRQMREKESNIEDIEKALCSSQQQLQEIQATCDKKLVSEKEQHTIEIQQTMKLKYLVEEENNELQKENMKLKQMVEENVQVKEEKPVLSVTVDSAKIENKISKQSIIEESVQIKNEPEENTRAMRPKQQKMLDISFSSVDSNTRTMRPKQQKMQDISFSSVDSPTDKRASDKVTKEKSRKRVSDADFVLPKERASKRMKSSTETTAKRVQSITRAESKTSLKQKAATVKDSSKKTENKKLSNESAARSSKRKIQTGSEQNLSPMQKIANRIGAKFKSVCENVESASKSISSPRITRGRKKLFNPEGSSSSTSEKITRGRKLCGKE